MVRIRTVRKDGVPQDEIIPKWEIENAILRGAHLKKRFPVGEGVDAVNGVTLEIARGEFVVITGASGCGKSTLLSLLGGLDRPSHGEVILDDIKLSRLGENDLARLRRQKVGFVFQFFNLLNDLTAAENIGLPMRLLNTPLAEIQARTRKLLDAIGMLERSEHLPFELSGGEQQRVAVARALANHPDIVLADEPTGNLDSVNSREIFELFKVFNETRSQTFIVVTHDPAMVGYADRVLEMKDGRIVAVEAGGRR